MSHQIRLDVYEGPIDLLVDQVRRGELDICEVSLARIAREYLEYVRLLEAIDLAAAGDFVAMAVTLVRLKLRMLLPSRLDEAEEIGPMPTLAPEEYLEVRKLAEELAQMQLLARNYFSRPRPVVEEEKRGGEETAGFLDLISAFRTVIERERRVGLYTVHRVFVSVEERMEEILEMLKGRERVNFLELFQDSGRSMLVTTFVAILELIRVRRIRAVQPEAFGPIWIRLRAVDRESCPA